MTQQSVSCTQMALELFPPESFEEILRARQITGICVNVSRRLRRGWHVTLHGRGGSRTLVVPAFLEQAPRDVKTALIDWTLLLGRPLRAGMRSGKKNLERSIFNYIRSSGHDIRNRSSLTPARLVTRGCRYDLKEVFDSLNNRYFNGTLSSHVRWGRHPLRSFQANRHDAAGAPCSLITIGSIYDNADVPRYAVEAIMYHEMLHIAHPPFRAGGRTVIHGREFKQRERSFPHHEQWLAWEKTCCKLKRRKD
jgi:hypothetical protein